jgi:hypothetical protein
MDKAPRLAREQTDHTMAQQLCIMCKSSAHVWKIELHPLGLLATLAHTLSEGFSQSRCADPVASRSRAVAPFPYVIGAASDHFDLARSRDRTLHRDCGHTADTAPFRSNYDNGKLLISLARPDGFEPPTPRFVSGAVLGARSASIILPPKRRSTEQQHCTYVVGSEPVLTRSDQTSEPGKNLG